MTPLIASSIAALSLLVSVLTFIFHRRDKSAEKLEKLQGSQERERAAQAQALRGVETAVHRRIDDLVKNTNSTEQENQRKLAGIDTRLATLDERVRNLPSHRDMQGVQESIAELSTLLGKVDTALKHTSETTLRINNYLMEKGS
ncbi:hypothetical protein ED208_12515 [Stagnimonas aquatica]|uniref:DUF2730 family protein n=1 Tax=Stagnimonas aquatica TaxID=2689987 RepID=A0A3N0V7H5_9GAMM|nr:hypothetical protein [Stagnimonas aquatica]ROH88635.1 hypothetical protein ED208_12515 [Stagnimonas aquatica]